MNILQNVRHEYIKYISDARGNATLMLKEKGGPTIQNKRISTINIRRKKKGKRKGLCNFGISTITYFPPTEVPDTQHGLSILFYVS